MRNLQFSVSGKRPIGINSDTYNPRFTLSLFQDVWTSWLLLRGFHAKRSSRRKPDSKVHGANMGPTWVLSVPDGPHVGPMNLAIRETMSDMYVLSNCAWSRYLIWDVVSLLPHCLVAESGDILYIYPLVNMVMAWGWAGNETLPEPMVTYCWLTPPKKKIYIYINVQ